MSTKVTTAHYDESSIQEFSGIAGIRKRPTMYIQILGSKGVEKMFLEIITNSVDEFTAGRCSYITISINTKEKKFCVSDNGSGIPIGKLQDILTKPHVGGKFDSKAYDYSAGMNGVGTTVTNALAKYFQVIVHRDGKRAYNEYAYGVEKKFEVKDVSSAQSGTMVTFIPDEEIMGEVEIDKDNITNIVEGIVYANVGLQIELSIDGKSHVYKSTNGISEYIKIIAHRGKSKLISDTFFLVEDKTDKMELQAAIGFDGRINGENIKSYVNSLNTINHGTHVSSMKAGVTMAIKKFIADNELIPKSSKLEITGEDIRDTLVAVVLAKHRAPLFDTQTKESLSSDDFSAFGKSATYRDLMKGFNKQKDIALEICKHIIRIAKAKRAAKEVEGNVLKANGGGGSIFDKGLNKNLKPCRSRKKSECEIFIIEGESAGCQASNARDADTQALFYLKGKVKNVIKDNKLTEELTALIKALGCGTGAKFDISRLQYDKIIFMTDADDDGGHIAALLAGFFYKYYTPLITGGHIYITKPPLYALAVGRKIAFIANKDHLNKVIMNFALGHFELITSQGKVLSKRFYAHYIRLITTFARDMETYAKWTNLEPLLLEQIVLHFDAMMTGDYSFNKEVGYNTTEIARNRDKVIFEFDKGVEHMFFQADSQFYETVYKPLYTKLSEIKISGVFLRSKKSSKIFGGTAYLNSKLISDILETQSSEVKRFKGLGEMKAEWLSQTAMHPSTRMLVQLTMDDALKAETAIDTFLGNDIASKKLFFADDMID